MVRIRTNKTEVIPVRMDPLVTSLVECQAWMKNMIDDNSSVDLFTWSTFSRRLLVSWLIR